MKRRSAILVVLAVLLAAGGLWYLQQATGFSLSSFKRIAGQLNERLVAFERQVSNPGPLVATEEAANAKLTQDGVLRYTNLARKENGDLPPLVLNAKLNAAALGRAEDMFANQYFAHESPDGKDAVHLAEENGYAYALIGENIALGNFADDQALVQAWMDSPGHRANILNAKYQDVGIAVLRGTYEGRKTWIAVQIFGRPLSSCPGPSADLKAQIDADQATYDSLVAKADRLRADIDTTPRPKTRQQADDYNAKVAQYNALVDEINALVGKLKAEIAAYNNEVNAFNACVGT